MKFLKLSILHFVLLLAAAIALFPLVWLVCASFKTTADLGSYILLPWRHLQSLTFDNFDRLFTDRQIDFLNWVVNSLFLSCLNAVVTVTLSSLGGFALAKYNFRGKVPLMALMLATMMLPSQVLLPSSYELMNKLGWLDSFLAILVPGAVSVFGTLLLMQAMKGVPDELLQAGRVDGCTEIRLWWEVALPIVRPMMGAFTLMSFLGSWNSFIWPQIVLQDERKYTLPIGLANMVATQEYAADFGILMAATLLAIVPVAILFFVLQKEFIAGLTTGAVKG